MIDKFLDTDLGVKTPEEYTQDLAKSGDLSLQKIGEYSAKYHELFRTIKHGTKDQVKELIVIIEKL